MSVISILSTLFNKCQIKDMIGTSSLKLHGCQTGLIFITFPALWYHNIAAADTGDILDILTFGPQPSRGEEATQRAAINTPMEIVAADAHRASRPRAGQPGGEYRYVKIGSDPTLAVSLAHCWHQGRMFSPEVRVTTGTI